MQTESLLSSVQSSRPDQEVGALKADIDKSINALFVRSYAHTRITELCILLKKITACAGRGDVGGMNKYKGELAKVLGPSMFSFSLFLCWYKRIVGSFLLLINLIF